MKQLSYLLLACALAFTGCSKEEAPDHAEPYIGKWVQTAYRNSSTNSFIGQEDGTYVQFNADGTFTHFYSGWGSFNETTTGTYKMTSDMSMELSIAGEASKATVDFYDVEGNTETLQFLFFHTGTYKFEKQAGSDNSVSVKVPYSPDH
jgi:hypothetical protein